MLVKFVIMVWYGLTVPHKFRESFFVSIFLLLLVGEEAPCDLTFFKKNLDSKLAWLSFSIDHCLGNAGGEDGED